jgi:hypothetical protein
MKTPFRIQTAKISRVVGDEGIVPLLGSLRYLVIPPTLHTEVNDVVGLVAALPRDTDETRVEAFVNQKNHYALAGLTGC